jgi:MFS family permease
VLSLAGDQFAQVAIAILVYRRTHSAFLTALAYALTYLRPIAGGPLLSGLADLFPRRRVMIACDVLRIGTVGLTAVVPPSAKSASRRARSWASSQARRSSPWVNPYRTLGLDTVSCSISALIVAVWVKVRPLRERGGGAALMVGGVGRRDADRLRQPEAADPAAVWLAGFYIVPEGLAAPYAHSLHGSTLTVGLLMAAMPIGMVVGGALPGRFAAPSVRMRTMGWLAVLSCPPFIGSAWDPPLWSVLLLWVLAGAGGAYQLIAAATFVQALRPATRVRAFGLAQSGLSAVQGLGMLAGGAVAQAIGPPLAVGLAWLAGLAAAAMLAATWAQLTPRRLKSGRPKPRARAELRTDGAVT